MRFKRRIKNLGLTSWNFIRSQKFKNYKSGQSELKLHLGCGQDYKEGWVNIDRSLLVKTDINSDFLNIKRYFDYGSVDVVSMMHSISYLSLWEARIFFGDVFQLLKEGGVLEMEFPDISKCGRILSGTQNIDEYIEAVRGVFAFDLNQTINKEKYKPYAFGWSAWHIENELTKAGFTCVRILDPLTHGQRSWRDTRVEAVK